MEKKILPTISSPQDIKSLQGSELERLCGEIRETLIETTAVNGGHLASNLGVVELTLALHRAFDCPKDKIVFDVGHQSYVHKLVTGRQSEFQSIRTEGGLSGFPKRMESDYDAFDTGHSSTSLSAALGLLRAKRLQNEDGFVVALIGDGALTGGMAFEALNDIGQSEMPLIIIFNDNNMSISRNVGAISHHLNEVRSSHGYLNFKKKTESFLTRHFHNGEKIHEKLSRFRDRLKYFLLPNNVFFENFGIKYWGPVDGHDIAAMEETFERAKSLERPVIIHVITKKGKGYLPAEEMPEKFHGIGKFDPCTGETKPSTKIGNSAVMGDMLCSLARENPQIAAVCAAMPLSTGLVSFSEFFPERFFDVGIAEGHAVTMAAGLAAGGMRPVVAVYSSFLQRAYDQLLHDVCLQRLPVTFCVDRAGLVGEDGETHQGIYDVAFLLTMPYIQIWSPSTQAELRTMLKLALTQNLPVAIRYPRTALPEGEARTVQIGVWEILRPLQDVTVVASGSMLKNAIEACRDMDVGLVSASFIRPMDENVLQEMKKVCKTVITVEDGLCAHGFGMQVENALGGIRTVKLGVPDEPIKHAGIPTQQEKCGLSPAQIKTVLRQCGKEEQP